MLILTVILLLTLSIVTSLKLTKYLTVRQLIAKREFMEDEVEKFLNETFPGKIEDEDKRCRHCDSRLVEWNQNLKMYIPCDWCENTGERWVEEASEQRLVNLRRRSRAQWN